ncbi:hypothetical protein ABGB18_45115 [Nonomuraea sp. B12E4]|uniref:hypothetical protein n=1 Tax=Nonomuraea sp. B12E4 TaxID=3153564 RepID=UPI00325F7562
MTNGTASMALPQAAREAEMTVLGRRRPECGAPKVARRFGLTAAAGLGPPAFYPDLAAPRGRRHVRVCGATACFAAQVGRHLPAIEDILGVTEHLHGMLARRRSPARGTRPALR